MAADIRVKLVIPSEVTLVDVAHAATEKMAELAGFDAEGALNLGLAVREAVINAMLHGNGQDPALDTNLTLSVLSDGLQARVRDHGSGFDPDNTPDPTEGDNLLRTSGRGLLLIRAFVDDVEFESAADGGTVITMTKRHPSTGAAQGGS
jgi:serine/threonine-protein kinase RsbW